ncbi:calcium/sodium antiporter [Proteobacteria bacterium 005FR1]|nr:calcium/sodium antiporter [Proteobacteria bacterium 005FR1]
MPAFWLAWILVIAGILGLVWSADRFVAGSAALADSLGVRKIVIGLTVVSLGTSAPEILVSINAALADNGQLAIGNAIGSNIANMGLVLAVTALTAAIPVRAHLLREEVPALLFVTLLAGILLMDGELRQWEGVVLIAAVPLLLYITYRFKIQHPGDVEAEEIPALGRTAASLWFAIGLVVLIASANVLVRGAEAIALHLGVSPLVVGLTVVAVGTSLPELAASVASALKGHHDIALGNVIGSNIFNLLAVMAIPGVIGLDPMEPTVFYRDYLVMAAITLLLCGAIVLSRRGSLGRPIGAILLLSYIGYYLLLFRTGAAAAV